MGAVLVAAGAVRWRDLGRAGDALRPNRIVQVVAGVAAVAVVAFALTYGLRPIRADRMAHRAQDQSAEGQATALRTYSDAARLAKWEPEYYSLLADDLLRRQTPQTALLVYRVALAKDDRRFPDVVNAASAAAATGAHLPAVELYQRALHLDPNADELRIPMARSYLAMAQAKEARQQADIVVRRLPERPESWELLGDLEQRGDPVAASEAYDRALALGAGSEVKAKRDLVALAVGAAGTP
jgi:predicted Zn-dependent protease